MTDFDNETMLSGGELARVPEVQRGVDKVAEAARTWAQDVDARARFPREAVATMRDRQFMTCAFPRYRGGYGLSLREIAAAVRTISSRCAATGMVFATHQIQAITLLRHAPGSELDEFLGEMLEQQYLLTAATAEFGSGVIVERAGYFDLTKHARMVAYAEYCDAILATARPAEFGSSAGQVLAVCRMQNLTLERTSDWDVLGLRGVRAPSFVVRAAVTRDLVVSTPYSRIFAETVRPVAYTLWAAVCLGIVDAALGKAADHVASEDAGRSARRRESRLRLSDAEVGRAEFTELVDRAADRFDDRDRRGVPDPDSLDAVAESLEVDNLEVMASRYVVDLVAAALTICGVDGYRSSGDFTVERHVRDAHGIALLMNNYRIVTDPV